MPKLEYCEVQVTVPDMVYQENKADIWISWKDRNPVRVAGGLGTLFADLGLQGWELVGANAHKAPRRGLGGWSEINYMFKRALPE